MGDTAEEWGGCCRKEEGVAKSSLREMEEELDGVEAAVLKIKLKPGGGRWKGFNRKVKSAQRESAEEGAGSLESGLGSPVRAAGLRARTWSILRVEGKSW